MLRNGQALRSKEEDTAGLVFRVFQSQGYWKWKLIDDESSIIAESKSIYRTREDAEQGIKIIKLKILKAEIEVE